MFRMVGLTTEPLVVAVPKNVAQRELNERASALILSLSEELFALVPHMQPDWSKAYYRFCCAADGNSSAASCKGGASKAVDPAANPEFFCSMDEKADTLIKLFGKTQGVLLLIIGADASYKVDFDWDDLGRWPIAADGTISGLPQVH
ncbi:MAG: hypothetical protein JO002_08860 [Burkholderiaceae bacterium]|nr:hypothetical protein [Burkholderiaceae bacterium]